MKCIGFVIVPADKVIQRGATWALVDKGAISVPVYALSQMEPKKK